MNEIKKQLFLPIKTSREQNNEAPALSQTEKPEPTDDDPDDPIERVEEAYESLDAVLEAAILYFLARQQARKSMPTIAMPVREKIMLLTDLLPSAEQDYMVRFGVNLAHALWADSERSRILSVGRMHKENWLEELDLLADWMVSAAFGLEESMGVEHDDFAGPFRYGKPPED